MRRFFLVAAWYMIAGAVVLSLWLFVWPRCVRWSNNRAGSSYGGCELCGDRYSWKPYHEVQLTRSTGAFLFCQECWDHLTPDERAAAYVREAEQLAKDVPNYFRDGHRTPGGLTMMIDEFSSWPEYIEGVRCAVLEDRGGLTGRPFLERKTERRSWASRERRTKS